MTDLMAASGAVSVSDRKSTGFILKAVIGCIRRIRKKFDGAEFWGNGKIRNYSRSSVGYQLVH
jgi:hypothetical protein